MKLFRFATVALLTGALMVACDDDETSPTVVITPPAPAPIFGTVSGTVSVEGSGFAGVSVNLTGTAAQSATTGSSGGYSFSNVPAGAHNVGISGTPPDVAFVSTSTPVTIATNGQTVTADFSGNYIRTSSITGSVTVGAGDDKEGVVATVTAAGSGMLTDEEAAVGSSDTDGNFELTGLRAGGYAVTISDYPEGTEFPVTTRDVTVGVGLSATVSFNAPGEDRPTTGTNPFLPFISGVTSDSDDDTYSGRLTATVDIERERGDARFEKITLYVDGSEAASQSFGLASAPAEGPELAAQQIVFRLSFDSDEYDETGAVTYSNGAHKIVAGVTVQGSTEEGFSNQFEVEFDNPDGVHASAVFQGDPVTNSDTGEGWYGGPDAGITVTGIPVSYSGDGLGSLTLLDVCGNKFITDSEAPFVFEPKCDETRVLTEDDDIFRIAEREVGILNGEGVFPLRLDFEGPGAPRFQPNPNDRTGGWINDAVGLTAKHDSKKNDDGWLVYGASGGGVGGNAPQLRYSTTTPSIVGGALAAEASPEPTLPAATKKATAICFIASAVDLLGNESALPADDDACVIAAVYKAAVDVLEAAEEAKDDEAIAEAQGEIPAGILAGVDVTEPTIAFSAVSPTDKDRNLSSEFQVQVDDEKDGSGFSSMPVFARLQIRKKNNDVICGDGDEEKTDLPGNADIRGNCLNTNDGFGEYDADLGLATTDGVLGNLEDPAYHTLTAYAKDQAGNPSDEISRTALNDTKGAEALLAGSFDVKNSRFNMFISLKDDLSIRDYYLALNFPAEGVVGTVLNAVNEDVADAADQQARFRLTNPVAVDTYNTDAEFKQTLDPSGTQNAFLALQGTNAEDNAIVVYVPADNRLVADAGVTVYVRDQSQSNRIYTAESMAVVSPFADAADGFVQAGDVGDALMEDEENGIIAFSAKADDDEYDVSDMIELTAKVSGHSVDAKDVLQVGDADGPDGPADDDAADLEAIEAIPFENPFKRVDFYAVSEAYNHDGDATTGEVIEFRYIASVSSITGRTIEDVDADDDGEGDVKDGTNDDDADDDDNLSADVERTTPDNEVTYLYETKVSAADFYATVQGSGKGSYSGIIIGVGVRADGMGLVSQVIDVQVDK